MSRRLSNKWNLAILLSTSALAILGGCFSGSEDEAKEGGSAIAGNQLDDAVATSFLKGGCSVVIDGRVSKTAGTGGECPTTLSGILDFFDAHWPPRRGEGPVDVFAVSDKLDHPGDPTTLYRFIMATESAGQPLYIATVGTNRPGEDGVELMGFSPKLQAFAYYKIEDGKWIRKGDATQVKTMTDGSAPPFECISCHTTGAPLMKELHDSWGNWQSRWSSSGAPWDGANDLLRRLWHEIGIADNLEPKIIDGIKLANKSRVERAAKAGELKGILTQLMCEVGEANLIGTSLESQKRLGTVVLGRRGTRMLPTAILTNQLLVPSKVGTIPGESSRRPAVELGLEDAVKLNVPALWKFDEAVDGPAYSKALEDMGQTIGGQPGDNIFAMTSPEKSYADLDAIQELYRRNLIDKETIADVLMTDFTVSSFSKIRCDLAQTIPMSWSSAADLKTKWSQELASSNLRGAKGLKARFAKDNQLDEYAATIESFANKCLARPRADLTSDILRIVSQRRVEFTERYESVIESDWLIPKDNLGSRPGVIRLSPECTMEDSSKKFVGED
jgi:hypothetical protein